MSGPQLLLLKCELLIVCRELLLILLLHQSVLIRDRSCRSFVVII